MAGGPDGSVCGPAHQRDLITCVSSLDQKQRACQSAIALGQTVISKHKNLRYYSSRVTQISSQTFYEVMFDDGSFSNDTYPEDIVVRLSSGAPADQPSVNTPSSPLRAAIVSTWVLLKSGNRSR